jgi:hypothetical protein
MVVGLLAALVGGAALLAYTPWDWLFGGGLGLCLLGLAVGVPTGLWYHLRLYRAVRERGPLPARWWVRPDRLHGRLTEAERALVMRPFYFGAVGFVLSVLGCILVAYGAWRSPPG